MNNCETRAQAIKLMKLYNELKEEDINGLISVDEYLKKLDNIVQEVNNLLSKVPRVKLISLKEEDVILAEEGPTYKGKEPVMVVNESGMTELADDVYDFLYNMQNKNYSYDAISIASGFNYILYTNHYNEEYTFWFV